MRQISVQNAGDSTFKECVSTAVVFARVLTVNDFVLVDGCISTVRGNEFFMPGDVLVGARGKSNLAIIKQASAKKILETIGLYSDGWADYKDIRISKAAQITEEFVVNLKDGTMVPGDEGEYVVIFENSIQILTEDQFDSKYKFV